MTSSYTWPVIPNQTPSPTPTPVSAPVPVTPYVPRPVESAEEAATDTSQTLYMQNGDIYISERNGRGLAIDKTNKCNQDLSEMLMTAYDAARDYGNEVATLDIPAQLGSFVAPGIIKKKLDEAVQRLKQMQLSDPNSTPEERIARISRLDVISLSSTDYLFILQVETEVKDTTEIRLAVNLGQQINPSAVDALRQLAIDAGGNLGT